MRGSRGGGQGVLMEPIYFSQNHKAKGFLSNTGPDPMKNHKATEPAFNVGPSMSHQRNAILMAFHWRSKTPFKWSFAGGPMMANV